jgi:hypothetical protein
MAAKAFKYTTVSSTECFLNNGDCLPLVGFPKRLSSGHLGSGLICTL